MKNRKLTRLKGYDYSSAGYYFVTICTKDRVEWFGEIANGEMVLNEWGRWAKELWFKIPNHFQNITLDQFVVMPNHIHGIIIVGDPMGVGNGHARSLHVTKINGRSHETIPAVIGSYKSAVTRAIHAARGYKFQWQKSFYDRIIRDQTALDDVKRYILNNPAQWDLDKDNLIFQSRR